MSRRMLVGSLFSLCLLPAAAWPQGLPPEVSEAAKLTASDGAPGDVLGYSIAMDGDTVVVGARGDDVDGRVDQGAVYVFVRPEGGWAGAVEVARLTASDGAANDQFGVSVAISGDTVVVGAWGDDNQGMGGRGSAYVFVRPEGGWEGTLHERARLTASDRQAGDLFGASVAISGGLIAVGAPWDDFGDFWSAQGSAYVFVRPGAAWINATETAKLIASDKAAYDRLGSSVAVDGDTVVVGAPYDDVSGKSDQGSAYVFQGPGWLGQAAETAKLTAADGAAFDAFGYSVAVSGDTVVVGSIFHRTFGTPSKGAAYVYVKPVAGWATTSSFNAELTAYDGAETDRLGESVAIQGDVVVAGAVSGSGPNHVDQGAAYVFVKGPFGWWNTSTFDARLTASDGAQSDRFGGAVALSGDTVVVGAWGDNFGSGFFQGSAHVFDLP
jgi:hypothetical protein